jgi:transcriptional regulator with XRE-family HTH domain
MVYYSQMDDVQTLLADLKAKGWTNASIADSIGVTVNAVEKWQSGDRNADNRSLILLNLLTKRKHIPKKRRYAKGSRTKTNSIATKFNASLSELDTETQTYGCRQNNPAICKKNGLAGVCAFIRADGVCKSPSTAWAKQYRLLSSSNRSK